MKLNTKVMLVLTLFINTLLLFRYIDMAQKGANWWATILLTDIVLYYAIVLQMLLEWRNWNLKLFKWRQDLIFE